MANKFTIGLVQMKCTAKRRESWRGRGENPRSGRAGRSNHSLQIIPGEYFLPDGRPGAFHCIHLHESDGKFVCHNF